MYYTYTYVNACVLFRAKLSALREFADRKEKKNKQTH